MSYHNIPAGDNFPETLNALVEIPKGTSNKYEYDEALDVIKLDRVLYSPMFYPVDYGFVPGTRAGDGDHSDVLIVTNNPTFPGCLVEVRPIGVLKMTDDKGEDNKVLAVPVSNPHYKDVNDITDIEPHILKEIKVFFEQYKTLEEKEVKVDGWGNKAEAHEILKKERAAFSE